jgi:hypothetical protein
MLATVALGWFTLSDSISVPKISPDRSFGRTTPSEEDVTARLWEDPLLAVQTDVNRIEESKNPKSKHNLENLRESVRQKLGEDAENRVLLMVVPIPGTPFPDDVESRLRIRYSIQMALAWRTFVPDNRDHLGYVNLTWPGANSVHPDTPTTPMKFPERNYSEFIKEPTELELSGQKTVAVPYEWFIFPDTPNRRDRLKLRNGTVEVVIIWLPEELLGDEPLCRLAYLKAKLTPDNLPPQSKRFSGPFVVGPRSSDSLMTMAKISVRARSEHTCCGLLKDNLRIFSPEATIPDVLIGLNETSAWSAAREEMNGKLAEQISGSYNSKWRYFDNFIAPDDQLTDLLVQELARRRINFSENSDDVVLLLAEADTSYGQSLPRAFQASIESLRANSIFSDSSDTPCLLREIATDGRVMPNLVIARYLKGLDSQKGSQGTAPSTGKDSSRSAEQLLAEALSRKSAPALGESQLDYAERLAEMLARQPNDPANTDPKPKRVKAVGILGGDIYDKLILLRSLRSRFPESLFFTTDLDARLWNPDQFKFTRNIVVASAYGVELDRVTFEKANPGRHGLSIPPFRDGYQVARFIACVAALNEITGKSSSSLAPPPSIYEIGRGGAVKLLIADERPRLPKLKEMAIFLSPLGFVSWAVIRHRRRKVHDTTEIKLRDLFHKRTTWVGWFFVATNLALMLAAVAARGRLLWVVTLFSVSIWLLLCVFQMNDLRRNRIGDGIQFSDLFRARTGWAGWFALAAFLLLAVAAWVFRAIGTAAQGEPWSWTDGVSVWPTELIRLSIICAVVWMLVWSWQRYLLHRRRLIVAYQFRTDPEKWSGINELSSKTVLARVFEKWCAPTLRARASSKYEIDAIEVAKSYFAKATLGARCFRAAIGATTYFCLAIGLMLWSGIPLNTHIRGLSAFALDQIILFASIICWLALVFYVLDAVCLAAQMLNRIHISVTNWPRTLLEAHKDNLGVRRSDLDGYLNVIFAAEKSQETGKLVLLPFLIQFLMLLARNSYFDNWTWPPTLIFIFLGNVVLSAMAWIILRRSAARLKVNALETLAHNLIETDRDIASHIRTIPSPEVRRIGLQEIKRRIEEEVRGAYARWFQDPAVLAMLVPTGLLGILSVLFQALFGVT